MTQRYSIPGIKFLSNPPPPLAVSHLWGQLCPCAYSDDRWAICWQLGYDVQLLKPARLTARLRGRGIAVETAQFVRHASLNGRGYIMWGWRWKKTTPPPPPSIDPFEVVQALYTAVLGRKPDADGEATYVSALSSKALSPIGLLHDLQNSVEGQRHRMDQAALHIVPVLYDIILGRPISDEEEGLWSNAISQGAHLSDVLIQFEHSREAALRRVRLFDERDDVVPLLGRRLVEALYLGILERAPSEAEREQWGHAIEQGLPLSHLVDGIEHSEEAAMRQLPRLARHHGLAAVLLADAKREQAEREIAEASQK